MKHDGRLSRAVLVAGWPGGSSQLVEKPLTAWGIVYKCANSGVATTSDHRYGIRMHQEADGS